MSVTPRRVTGVLATLIAVTLAATACGGRFLGKQYDIVETSMIVRAWRGAANSSATGPDSTTRP